jgi:hypothetical protein
MSVIGRFPVLFKFGHDALKVTSSHASAGDSCLLNLLALKLLLVRPCCVGGVVNVAHFLHSRK